MQYSTNDLNSFKEYLFELKKNPGKNDSDVGSMPVSGVFGKVITDFVCLGKMKKALQEYIKIEIVSDI